MPCGILSEISTVMADLIGHLGPKLYGKSLHLALNYGIMQSATPEDSSDKSSLLRPSLL